MERTDYCGELRLKDVGRSVTLLGWVSTVRKLGAIAFIDLRDNTGIVQLTEKNAEAFPDARSEYVIEAKGVVAAKDTPNHKIPTGEIEIILDSIKILSKAETTPFIIADKTDALEETRLQYRYLDLRRPCMLDKLRTRAKIVKTVHEYLDSRRFLEVETPCLGLSSPEGAKEYLVPSRVHPGSFYALDQSPQQYKQLLMIGGVERYYQIAKCFRDEDLRADRQPEFTQVDIEASFLDQDEILSIMEGLLAEVFKKTVGYDVQLPLRRLPFWEALDRFGSDKPDTRYGMELQDVSQIMRVSSFPAYSEANMLVKGIVVPGGAEKASRKLLEELTGEAKKFNLKAYMALKGAEGTLTGPFAKFLEPDALKELASLLGMKDGDAFFFAGSTNRRDVDFGLGALRTRFAKELGLIKEGTYDLLWVVDFPMFCKSDTAEGGYVAEHHPFTRPRDEDLPLLDTDPEKVLAYAYDIIINGYEAGGGTLRIYDHDTQWKIFKILGLNDEQVAKKFGWFIDAFKYGTPPHGGIGFGLDRIAMILSNTDNIRDVEAFPKNLQAVDPMNRAPGEVDVSQLDILGLQLKK